MPIDLEAERSLRRRVGVERYATILAHCLHAGPDRAGEVVARFGLDLETWLALDAAWSRELAESSRRQQNLQATRFTTTLFRVRAELAMRSVAGEAPGPNEVRSGAAVAAAGDAGSTPRRVAASFQLAMPTAAAPPAAPSPPAILVTPAAAAAPNPAQPRPAAPAVPAASTPAEAAPPAAAPAPAPSFALPERKQGGGGVSGKTEDMRESRVRAAREQGALPFDEGDLPISLETYARVTARLAQRADRSEVLADALLDEEKWQAAARRWSDRLRRDVGLMRKYIELVGQMKGEG